MSEPEYSGKPLSYWVLGDHQSASYANSPQYLDPEGKSAIREAGTNAIPFLLEWITSNSPFDSYRAAQGFGVLGSNAQSALPDLTDFATNLAGHEPLQSEFGRWQLPLNAVHALRGIGRDALPALGSVVHAGVRADIRAAALDAIADFGTNARPVVPLLLDCLKDSDHAVVRAALFALVRSGSQEESVFVSLKGLLNSPESALRFVALEGMANFGERAVPHLIHGLRDADTQGVWLAGL